MTSLSIFSISWLPSVRIVFLHLIMNTGKINSVLFIIWICTQIKVKDWDQAIFIWMCIKGGACCCCCCCLWTAGMSDELDVVWADGNKVHERSVYQHRPTHPHNPKNSQRNTIARLFVRKWLHLKSSQKLQSTFCGSSLRSTRPTPPLIIKLVSFFVIFLHRNGGEGDNLQGSTRWLEQQADNLGLQCRVEEAVQGKPTVVITRWLSWLE